MSDRKMLIVDASVLAKIDENRGDLSRSDFINFLIDSQLEEAGVTTAKSTEYVTKEELYGFEEGMKDLLRNFLEFFLSYGLELGQGSAKKEFEELNRKLRSQVSDKAKKV